MLKFRKSCFELTSNVVYWISETTNIMNTKSQQIQKKGVCKASEIEKETILQTNKDSERYHFNVTAVSTTDLKAVQECKGSENG